MKNVVHFIKNTLHFILSLFTTLNFSFFKKKDYAIVPMSNLSIQTETIRWKSISVHRNVRVLLIMLAYSGWIYGQSVQDFGTGTTSFGGSGVTSTSYLPNPSTGTNYVRISSGQGGGLTLQNPSALGTTGSSLRATAATGTSVVKVTPILNNTAGKVAYARFKVMFGDASAGNTAASGIWQMFMGNGASFSDANGFTSSQVNVGLQFTYGASGAITMTYRNNANWVNTSLTSNPLFQSVYYDFEIFSNNKSSGTENYTYNGVSSSVEVGKFDLYVNGRLLGNELNDGELSGNSDIRSIMFTGISSTSNVANIFIDDVTLQNTIPATTSRLTNPSAFDLSSGNYSFTSWTNTSLVGTTPSNMKFHWNAVNSQNPTLAQSVASQDYVWGYNYTMTDSRINGLGNDGIEFKQANTGHSSSTSGNLGEAVVSVNTSNRQDVQVSWKAALQTDAAVAYKLRGQYRIGNTGAYTDLPGTTAAIEFNSSGATVGTPTNYGPITLPAACNNQSEVQIRWAYYLVSSSGLCDGIRLDDISITSSCLAAVGGTIAGSTSKCSGTNSSTLTLSGHTGSIVKWQSSTSSTFASGVTDIANTTTTLTATNLTATTYYRAVLQSGSCSSANSSTATITITQPGSGNFAYASYGFCTSTTTAQAVSSSNFTGVTGTFSSSAGLSINASTGSILPSASAAGTYVVTYTIAASGGCSAYTTTTNVTIDAAGTGAITYSPSSLCTGTAGTISPIITSVGGSGSSTWITSTAGLAIDGSGVITPSASTVGTYTVTYNRSNTGLCAAYSTTTSVTINASPSITTSTPGSRCGTGSVVLGAVSSTGTVNWYTAATGGTSIASGNTYNTPSISANTTYYADAQSVNGCSASSRVSVLATVNQIPTVASTTPNSRCGTGSVSLGATASAGTINWYAASTGGASLGTGTTYNTPSISTTTNYYAEAVANGCSSARTAVAASVVAIPTVASTTPGTNCGTGSVTLGATSSGTLNWYAASTGGSALGTGTSYTTPSISANTTYYVDATANGCTSARTAVLATIATSPSISSFINGSRCNTGTVNLSATPSSGATIKWYAAASGGSVLSTGNLFTTPSLSATTIYYAEATIGSCIQPSRTAVTATINTTPVVAITADYCTVPGNVVLTANAGMTSYFWSNGANTQSINVDQAGNYTVFIVNPGGCPASGSLAVATELVTNGSFNAGNTGFTTSYSNVVDGAGQLEMYPEGTYAIVSNPNTVHDQFYGQDRNSPTGKMMVINGSPTLLTVWNQNNISVLPNTTYYFSGWGMSVVNGQNAILQFSINGSQVGPIAYLPNGYSNTAGPYTWVRFYGQWESGPLTTANLSIVNLNTIAGGNDFALDDISFGTMSPVALSANPVISGNAVCQNDPLTLTAGAIGGASPFTYSWSGPNGFTSTLENPLVTSTATSTQNGTYTVEVTDGFGCINSQSISVTVSAIPNNIAISATAAAVCSGGSTNINLSTSQTDVYYQLRNNATNANIGALVQGTGSAISLPTGILTATTTFNVLATRYPAGCDLQMSNTVTVTLSVTPEIAITNQAACSGTVNLTAAGVTAGSTGSGTLTYWTTIAATTAITTPTAVGSGTYYIKSTNGSCFDIEPVVVLISNSPSAAFSYAASYCTSGIDPIATVTGTAGVFSATPAGLIFVNTNNGEIDLSASTPGTYTVRNTVTPTGSCAAVNQTRSVTITAAPLAGFNYISNDLCQSANALSASPIFDSGASAGTFSTSAGLSLNTTSGVIDVSASTPGNYAVVNTRAASGGCPAFSDTTFLDINPYIFEGSVSSSLSDDIICLNEAIDLYSNATTYATVLLREKFNGSINNWIKTNNSTGGTPADAAWTLRPDDYGFGGDFNSNDFSQFYLSNSDDQGSGGNTSTILRSPVMSTIGFSSLSLDFFHYYEDRDAGDNAKVQISTNNTTWTDLQTYTTDQGSRTGFTNAVFNLNTYIGLPTVYIRFLYTASNDRYWAIDNVSVTGSSINYDYAWTSSPAGFSQTIQNPINVAPLANTYYTVTATNRFGCSTPTSPIPVTVNPLPADNAGLDQTICGSGNVTLGAAATAGNTYAWTPAATLTSATVAQPSANPVANTTYTLTETITATGCSISNDVVVSVTPLPIITSTTPAGRCGTGTVTLSAISSTGTMKWYSTITGGVALGTANTFTTPSISANTTYYVEATSASCVATSRIAVVASINAAPSISSQSTATATYSQNLTANTLSVVATAGSGTITGYQWYSNTSASTVGSTELSGATSASYVPSTATVGTLFYYCVVTNSNGCSVNSAFSGAINTLLTPTITSVTGTTPLISGQASATGYRGQTITINGTNFVSNATVAINGVAATVSFVNSTQLTAVVNNTGVNSTGNMVVTNPSNGAFVNSAFNYIGYLTSGTSTDWSTSAAWLGGTTPTVGSNATLAHANTCNSAVTASMNQVRVIAGASLTFGSASSSLTTTDLINDGTISWTNTGTLTIGNTIVFSGAAVFNAINGTVVFNKAGDQVLFSGLSDVDFNNVTLAGSGNKSLMTNTEMTTNNLIVSAGTTFDLTATDTEIDINGNLTLNGDMNPGTSEFKFTGTVNQSISLAGSGTILFNAMRVDKPSGVLLLNDNVQVQESLTMVQGNIDTQGFLLEIGKDLTQRGTIDYTSGMIQGKLRRWYAASTNTGNASGLFPMGQFVSAAWKNRHVLLEYNDAPTTGGHITVEFMAIPMINGALGTQNFITSSNTGGAGFQVSNFSNDGYWKIDNLSSTLIDGEYTIALSGEGFSLPNGLNELTIVKRVGGGDWFCPGTHLAPIGTIGLPTLHRSGVSGFSNFGFAGGPSNPLPITLVNFDGICDGSKVNLSWTTASESNNKMFVIEVSNDAKTWSTVETVLGAGNSNTIRNYALAVNSSYSNGSYYRLTQIDYNGDSETFDPIYVNCDKQGNNEVSIYPNPGYEVSNLDIKASEDMNIQLTVFSSTGQILLSQKTALKKGNNIITLDITNLSPGMYHVNIINDKKIEFSGSRSIIKR
jgi:uncharacterized protein (DUF2141 family)